MAEEVRIIRGDITDITFGVISHGVNCQGRFRSGVARAIAMKWPDARRNYLRIFENDVDRRSLLGTIQQCEIDEGLHVINMFTQFYYGKDGRRYADLKAIGKCLIKSIAIAKDLRYPFYIPKVGCGLGGLDWETEVFPLVQVVASRHKYDVTVIEF